MSKNEGGFWLGKARRVEKARIAAKAKQIAPIIEKISGRNEATGVKPILGAIHRGVLTAVVRRQRSPARKLRAET